MILTEWYMFYTIHEFMIRFFSLAQVDKGDNWQQHLNGVGKHPDGGITFLLVDPE
jgi:hypothetical protein